MKTGRWSVVLVFLIVAAVGTGLYFYIGNSDISTESTVWVHEDGANYTSIIDNEEIFDPLIIVRANIPSGSEDFDVASATGMILYEEKRDDSVTILSLNKNPLENHQITLSYSTPNNTYGMGSLEAQRLSISSVGEGSVELKNVDSDGLVGVYPKSETYTRWNNGTVEITNYTGSKYVALVQGENYTTEYFAYDKNLRKSHSMLVVDGYYDMIRRTLGFSYTDVNIPIVVANDGKRHLSETYNAMYSEGVIYVRGEYSDDPLLTSTLIHEAVHYTIDRKFDSFPRWADEGLATYTASLVRYERGTEPVCDGYSCFSRAINVKNFSRYLESGQTMEELWENDTWTVNMKYGISALFFSEYVNETDRNISDELSRYNEGESFSEVFGETPPCKEENSNGNLSECINSASQRAERYTYRTGKSKRVSGSGLETVVRGE